MKSWIYGNASIVDVEEVMFFMPDKTKTGVNVIAALKNGNMLVVQADMLNENVAMTWCKNQLMGIS